MLARDSSSGKLPAQMAENDSVRGAALLAPFLAEIPLEFNEILRFSWRGESPWSGGGVTKAAPATGTIRTVGDGEMMVAVVTAATVLLSF